MSDSEGSDLAPILPDPDKKSVAVDKNNSSSLVVTMASAVNWNLKPVVGLMAAVTLAVVLFSMLHTDELSVSGVMQSIGVPTGRGYDFSNANFLAEEIPTEVVDEAKKMGTDGIEEKRVDVMGADIFYRFLESSPSPSVSSSPLDKTFVLLHGQAFTSKTWAETLPTMQTLAKLGARVFAVDLPGYGSSKTSAEAMADKPAFLEALLGSLSADRKPIVVSPSMSGGFSIPLLVRNSASMCAYVPVAPVSTGDFTDEDYANVRIPTLIVVGERDTSLGRISSKALEHVPSASKTQVIPGARHPAYLDDPKLWHKLLFNFVKQVEC